MRTSLLAAAFSAVLALSFSPAAHAQHPNPYLDAGMRLYADFEYESALEQLTKASTVPENTPAQDVQIAIYRGLIRFELGDAAGAEGDFKTALALDPSVQLPGKVSPKVVQAFEKARSDILGARPQPVVRTSAPGTAPAAEPPLDGSDAPPPPTKVAVIDKPADTPRREPELSVSSTSAVVPADPLTVRPEPPAEALEAPRRSSSVLSYVLLGAGVALGGGGAWFGAQSSSSVDAARSERFQSVASGRLEDARTQALTANLMYGAAAVAVVTGVITLLTGGEAEAVAELD